MIDASSINAGPEYMYAYYVSRPQYKKTLW